MAWVVFFTTSSSWCWTKAPSRVGSWGRWKGKGLCLLLPLSSSCLQDIPASRAVGKSRDKDVSNPEYFEECPSPWEITANTGTFREMWDAAPCCTPVRSCLLLPSWAYGWGWLLWGCAWPSLCKNHSISSRFSYCKTGKARVVMHGCACDV